MFFINQNGQIKRIKRSFARINGQARELTQLLMKANGQVASIAVNKTSSLYSFQSHLFTNVNKVGRKGPSLAQCRSAYNVTWMNNPSFFNMNHQGIQIWTVPENGVYRIEVRGAGQSGSAGYAQSGDFNLTQNQKLHILVGQQAPSRGGGHGGTFVAHGNDLASAQPLIISGGGGGQTSYIGSNNQHGSPSGSGNPGNVGYGGANGQGGQTNTNNTTFGGGGGGGFYSSGVNTSSYGVIGFGFKQGGEGGDSASGANTANVDGGFGGGGAGYPSNEPAGGGGFSGGGGGGYQGQSNIGGSNRYGGGGGSYNAGLNARNLGWNESHGNVRITLM